jgi:hypothetical protein
MGNLLSDDEKVTLTEWEQELLGNREITLEPKIDSKNVSNKEGMKTYYYNKAVLSNLNSFIKAKQFTLKNGINIGELEKRLNILNEVMFSDDRKHNIFILFKVKNKTIVYTRNDVPREGILNDLLVNEDDYVENLMLEFDVTSFPIKVVKGFVLYEHDQSDKYNTDALIYLYQNYTNEELEKLLKFYDFLNIEPRASLVNTINYWKKDREKAWVAHPNGTINFFFNNYQALPFGNKINVLAPGYKNIYNNY